MAGDGNYPGTGMTCVDKKKDEMTIGFCLVCLLLFALAMSCGGGGESLEGKIKYTEYNFTCKYHQDRPPETAYEVNIGVRVENVSQEDANVASILFRFYNQAGEKLRFYVFLAGETGGAHTVDTRSWGWHSTLAPGQGSGMGFNQYFAEKVVWYDVFVTDNKGKEYACVRD